jgi:hypothetical protein
MNSHSWDLWTSVMHFTQLGLPEVAVNPLIAKSFVSYLKIVGRENLL